MQGHILAQGQLRLVLSKAGVGQENNMTIAQHMPVFALQARSECIIRSLGPDEKIAQRLAQRGILPGH